MAVRAVSIGGMRGLMLSPNYVLDAKGSVAMLKPYGSMGLMICCQASVRSYSNFWEENFAADF